MSAPTPQALIEDLSGNAAASLTAAETKDEAKLREHAEIDDETERLHETPAVAPIDER